MDLSGKRGSDPRPSEASALPTELLPQTVTLLISTLDSDDD